MPDPAASTSPVWLPLSTVLGFVIAEISAWLRDRRASKREREAAEGTRAREREAREAARREQRFERRTDFQRQTLLDLQEAVMKLIRTIGEMNHLDEMAIRAGGAWQKQLYGDDLSNRNHLANVQTTMLGVRVRDESVRKLLKGLKDECDSVILSDNKPDADHAMQRMTTVFATLNERIGELLRRLDDDEDAGRLTTLH